MLKGRKLEFACTITIFLLVLFYAGSMQGTLLAKGWKTKECHVDHCPEPQINEENDGWLLSAPLMPALAAKSNELRVQNYTHGVGVRSNGLRAYYKAETESWRPYERMERGIIPDDALMLGYGSGQFYFMPDLRILDYYGLTDKTVAHTQVASNRLRSMAHDRRPSAEYLRQRGVNIEIFAPAASADVGAGPRRIRCQVRSLFVDAVQRDQRAVGHRPFRCPRIEGICVAAGISDSQL